MSNAFREDLHFAKVEALGRSFTFLLNSREDHIQGFIERGEFYEREELELICQHAAGCKRLLDLGANIGTHSIYLAHRLNLERTTPIEPQPAILNILRANLGLNWHPSFDLSCLGFGLSDSEGMARIGRFQEANLGGTRLVRIDNGADAGNHSLIPLCAGDDFFSPGDFDLIKMDIEGMELDALRGMRRCLEGFQGILFVEVLDDNAQEFAQYCASQGWRTIDRYRRYERCENWLLKA